jgi:hypothetical protein
MKKIYKFEKTFGRGGKLCGLFLAEETDVAKVLGQNVHLGEVLGKHSDVDVTVDDSTLKMVSEDPAIIAFVTDQLGGGFGTNPIERHLEWMRELEAENAQETAE